MSENKIKINDVEYDQDDLNEEAKACIGYIAELQAELNVINKRATVLRAALSVFESGLQNALPTSQDGDTPAIGESIPDNSNEAATTEE